ncbi:hypothetical protein HPP92_013579 [Vanilla planifolia]|uniref:Uncharacterized protein n=1 Tax=Vanilla planifolia TaxID=51239 RepID=A0A835UWT7_VANPL|nr:hypothetical protein HPP92_013579 [Vanilla planifolia]
MELLGVKRVKSFGFIREHEGNRLVESIREASGSPVNLTEMIESAASATVAGAALGSRHLIRNSGMGNDRARQESPCHAKGSSKALLRDGRARRVHATGRKQGLGECVGYNEGRPVVGRSRRSGRVSLHTLRRREEDLSLNGVCLCKHGVLACCASFSLRLGVAEAKTARRVERGRGLLYFVD